jgi:hypothetical protein
MKKAGMLLLTISITLMLHFSTLNVAAFQNEPCALISTPYPDGGDIWSWLDNNTVLFTARFWDFEDGDSTAWMQYNIERAEVSELTSEAAQAVLSQQISARLDWNPSVETKRQDYSRTIAISLTREQHIF